MYWGTGNRCAKFYGVVYVRKAYALVQSRRQAKRVCPRVSKLYREKIYFPVTATTYPDAFYLPPPTLHSISNRPRDGTAPKICPVFSLTDTMFLEFFFFSFLVLSILFKRK